MATLVLFICDVTSWLIRHVAGAYQRADETSHESSFKMKEWKLCLGVNMLWTYCDFDLPFGHQQGTELTQESSPYQSTLTFASLCVWE